MMEQPTAADAGVRDINFSNGNKARAVTVAPGQDPAEILQALGIAQPKAVLIAAGGADPFDKDVEDHLAQLFSRGVARAALAAEALILDGGTEAGVMQLMGQGVADRGRASVLLGVAPAGRVTYPGGPAADRVKDGAPLDPNHSHFVLVDSDRWGGETETMFALTGTLAEKAPVVMLLAGGGPITRDEALRCVRRGWPLVVVQGSGGVADEIAAAWQDRTAFIDDAVLAEIVADGEVHLCLLDSTVEAMAMQILNLFQRFGDETLLKRTWERFAVYDKNAGRQQTSFTRIQFAILALGVLAVSLALTQKQVFGIDGLGTDPQPSNLQWLYDFLHYVIIIVPIGISILLAAANRFKAGSKWILLRAAAENMKSQIYQYRTRAGAYSDAATRGTTREAKLAAQLKDISGQLMTTTVNEAALRPYQGSIPPTMYGAAAQDDGFSILTPSRYIAVRLGDQLSYFEKKTNKLERKLKRLQVTIYIVGGLGTLLAAVGLELWVALTTTLAAAFTTHLEYEQTEFTLTKYNQTATNLENVRNWWIGLTTVEQADPTNISLLVENTEQVLQSELTGWVQQMRDALAALQEKQVKETPTGESA